jgi:hypothetical protein
MNNQTVVENEEVTVEYWNNGNKKSEKPKREESKRDSRGNMVRPLDKDGEYKTWYENGVLESVRILKDGITDTKEYWNNGNLKLEGTFVYGSVPTGRLRTYWKNGNRKSVETYIDVKDNNIGKCVTGDKKYFCKKTPIEGIQGFFDVKGKLTHQIDRCYGGSPDISDEDVIESKSWDK